MNCNYVTATFIIAFLFIEICYSSNVYCKEKEHIYVVALEKGSPHEQSTEWVPTLYQIDPLKVMYFRKRKSMIQVLQY